MVAISYFKSPPSSDGEDLGLSCYGTTQLFAVNVIVCEIKSVLDQEIITETTGKIWPLIGKGMRFEGALGTQKFFRRCEVFF